MAKAWMDSTLGEYDPSTTATREVFRTIKESKMSKDDALRSTLKAKEHEWQGLTEEEFVYFCSYVDHDTLSQIENVLRDKNELR